MTPITRRQFLKTVGLLTASAALPLRAAPQNRKRRPNILFILVDDLGKEWISGYGGQDIETPHIDALAATGMRFDNACSMPKCTPTRATLLTGQYPFRTGWINHWDVPRWGAGCHFDPNHYTTFATLLRRAGYKTAIAGKWQINDFRVQPGILDDHGFDDWCMWTGGEGGNPKSDERYWDPYIHTRQGSRTYEGKYGPDLFTDFLIDFMNRHRSDPMLLYFPMALTHTPFVATPDEPDAQGKMPRHKAMVRYMDKLVGRLVAALDDLGLREDTILFFTTDNGTARGVTGSLKGRTVRGGKDTLAESGVCAPFIVNGPGRVPRGIATDALTDFTDMLPTFADLAGVDLPADLTVDGRSIAPLILGRTDDSPRSWVMAMGQHTARLRDGRVVPEKPYADRVIRNKRWKLWIEDGKPSRLFDLHRDPGEETNLIDSSEAAAAAACRELTAVAAGFPREDAAPKYDPLPPRPWDRKPAK